MFGKSPVNKTNSSLTDENVYLQKEFRDAWRGKDPFLEVDKLEGKIFRHVKNRRTLQFSLNKKSYFAKIHHGVGWKEIFKNLIMFKEAVTGAKNEWTAINMLSSLGIDTMTVCAYGERGINPAKKNSFIITENIENIIELSEYCRNWITSPPKSILKHSLIRKLALISRNLNQNGINHRDYYLCHFLLDMRDGIENLKADELKLYLIDLHRCQIRKKTPYRWVVKDIAGLWFSAMDTGLSRNDCYRFIRLFSDSSLKIELTKKSAFWKDVNKTAKRLYRKEHERDPKGLPF